MLEQKKIAVVGSGISGLSAAWLLHRNGAHVTLFEKDSVFGGHTLTDTSSPYPVDLGFQVYNLTTYPHLVGFFESLGVDTEPSDMSFALSMDGGKLEWGSDGLDSVFAQRGNLFSPTFLLMVKDVLRFGKEAPKVLEEANSHLYRSMTLGEYLKQQKYSHGFIYNYVVPMSAAVWSVPNAQVLDFPVQMLIRFWVNHHLLDILQRPLWRVVRGRSREYVNKVINAIPDTRCGTGIASVRRPAEGTTGPVHLTTDKGEVLQYDSVVFATHSNTTLAMLGDDATPLERSVLEAVPYNENDVYLHTDTALMPVKRKVWSSWNLIGSTGDDDSSAVCVSYWINRLQHLPQGAPDMFVTLNPKHPPAKDKTYRKLSMEHPVFSFASVEAQSKIADMQGSRGAYFAGAWCGYGFHEDGIKSAVSAVTSMGASIPWTPMSVSPKMTLMDRLYVSIWDKFAKAAIKTGYLRLILPTGQELVYGSKDKCEAQVPAGEEWRGRPAPYATIRVFNFEFFRKVIFKHDTGLGEAYMDRDYETDDMGRMLATVVANAHSVEDSRGSLGVLNWVGDRLLHLYHLARPNTIEGSRKNIEEHYDAGNEMYKLFLDESMTYSAGVHHKGDSLYQAQMNKIDALVSKAGLKAGDRVLEIGCGWGAFAIRAAATTGCHVTGLTLSKEQLAEAKARVAAAGLDDKIDLLFCDYRDYPGTAVFDKVVSCEMIEAVGHEHLPTYFSCIGRVLKPGGKAVIQAISVPDERYEAYCNCSDFIREHIFPGGHLPSVGSMVEAIKQVGAGLSLHDLSDIGPDYAITLRAWREVWEEKREEVLKLGYSDRFWRKYRFYFAYCEAGFDTKYIHDFHLVWVKDQQAAAANMEPGAGSAVANRGMSAPSVLGTSSLSKALGGEMPADPLTQAVLALYFFLAGMLVQSHPFMWLLPSVWCVCAACNMAIATLSNSLLPFYRNCNMETRVWWCADLLHLLYSTIISSCSALYFWSEPGAFVLGRQPPVENVTTPTVIICIATGFCAFQLWLCVRNRLFTRTIHAILQYTTLLLLFGVAAYKGSNVAFLAISLCSEAASVPFLVNKLQNIAGVSPSSSSYQRTKQANLIMLIAFRALPFIIITIMVLLSPSAFTSLAFYATALAGMAYLNYHTYHKVSVALKDSATSSATYSATVSATSQPAHAHSS